MARTTISGVAWLLCLSLSVAVAQQEKLTVGVFYETLCPDSIRFITTQLYPVFKKLGGNENQYFNIDFVPYGKAETHEDGNGFSFTCQHGSRECEGNIMHACALRYLPEESRAAFINCSMSSSDPPSAGPSCASGLGLNFTRVEKCIGEDGPALLASNGNWTHSLNPALYYVPWILYNGQFSESDLAASQKNFSELLCSKLGQDGPSSCGVSRPNLTVSVFYETLCPDSIRFITTQLFPTFVNFGGFDNQYFDIDFVPYGKAQTTVGPNGTYSFKCQHGNAECEGNKMHACALKYLPAASTASFIDCSMSSSIPPAAGPYCAEKLGLNFTSVEACIEQDGPALLAANGNRTHSLDPELYYVPWILYNGVFSEADLADSQSNFPALICGKLGSNGPAQCSGNSTRIN